MSRPYVFTDLKPVETYLIDGQDWSVYDLPTAIPWTIHHLIDFGHWEERVHMVSRVLICLTTDLDTGQPLAGIIPYDERNEAHPIMLRRISGASTIVSVLNRLGFEPELDMN